MNVLRIYVLVTAPAVCGFISKLLSITVGFVYRAKKSPAKQVTVMLLFKCLFEIFKYDLPLVVNADD